MDNRALAKERTVNKAMEVIDRLSEAVRPIVAEIEARPAVTKDRYDQYMVAIERIAKRLARNPNELRTARRVAGVALVKAGANREGVSAALSVMG